MFDKLTRCGKLTATRADVPLVVAEDSVGGVGEGGGKWCQWVVNGVNPHEANVMVAGVSALATEHL